jgi:hypothetical protein
MNDHPYLRAYMAGISVPTPLLLIPLKVFFMARFVYNIPVPVGILAGPDTGLRRP